MIRVDEIELELNPPPSIGMSSILTTEWAFFYLTVIFYDLS